MEVEYLMKNSRSRAKFAFLCHHSKRKTFSLHPRKKIVPERKTLGWDFPYQLFFRLLLASRFLPSREEAKRRLCKKGTNENMSMEFSRIKIVEYERALNKFPPLHDVVFFHLSTFPSSVITRRRTNLEIFHVQPAKRGK